MGDELSTRDGDRRPDVVSEFDQTNGLADRTHDDALEPDERDNVFEDAMISLDHSPMVHNMTPYSEESRR
ncbi:hypothetical protein G3T36_04685 [Diaminobutyricibacter tongyongensis]|uniref:Uncharacterized protein n=1 Tax=Leifsonia tongyongensis TaxID=1268043 RepID=A0A6L9XUS7_9MICO|nr:hypothetical protein [Diaminobutyricibacter tongyongensis]NEN05161.1 hypothetical protein [Diaminobutyricibacter tongyongensis]